MPRQPRLDTPDTLNHVMALGIERTTVFPRDHDRREFVGRLATRAETGAWTVYALALLPNRVYLVVRTGTRPLGRTMRSLLTGDAGAFSWRHKRACHLFQNRYKPSVVEDEPYLLELVQSLGGWQAVTAAPDGRARLGRCADPGNRGVRCGRPARGPRADRQRPRPRPRADSREHLHRRPVAGRDPRVVSQRRFDR